MREHDMSMIQPKPSIDAARPGSEIDRLSLDHALHDFEVANARVVDLTQRLIGAGRELATVKEELAVLRREHEELVATHEQMQRSRAFKLATRIRTIRNAL